MRKWNTRHRTALHCTLLAGLTIILVACGSAPPRPQGPGVEPPGEETTSQEAVPEISLELPPSAFDAQFYQAERALADFNWMQASVFLDALPQEELATTDRIYRGYLQARIDYLRGQTSTAMESVNALNDPLLEPALQYRLLSFKQHMLSLSGAHLASAEVASTLLAMSPTALAPDWKRRTWLQLQRASADDLRAARIAATDPDWLAWLDLALLAKDNTFTLGHELRVWLNNHPDHVAANPVPGGLQFALDATPPPSRVALLLPLQGRLAPAGQAVLEGYLAAHYAERVSGGAAFDVMVMDTTVFESANAAYAAAVQNQAGMVIGPLNKDAVADLALEPNRPIPIIALNRIDADIQAAGAAMVQLSLSPEDEAQTLAALAFGRGARNALVIRPAGDWGNTVEAALHARWTGLGGSIADSGAYEQRESHSDSVKTALGLSDSEARARRIESILGTSVEFTPRRRQDPDVVFMLARSASEARSLRPLLPFHYAGNLPVYGLSSAYSGLPDARDKDLNGLKLVETPWLLGANPGLRVAIAAGDTGSDSYTRLNALGADAFVLQSQFGRLRSGPDVLINGNTGLLTMNPRLQMERELAAAAFDKGALKAR